MNSRAETVGQGRGSRMLLLAMRLVLASFLFAALTWTVADADLWGHLMFGRDILQLRSITSHDVYSFTSDIPWVNHEWLAEVLAYAAYAAGGAPGLVAAKALLVLAMVAMVLVVLRHTAADAVVHDLLVFLAVAGTYGRTITFRPQVFSLVLFPALLLTLVAAERGRPKSLMVVPLIFVVWANLHGGWIVGLAAFAVWGAWTFVRARQLGISRRWLVACGAASLLATLVNPYGVELWDFLGSTVRLSRNIADWQPLWRLPVALLTPWLTATLLVILAVVFERRRLNPAHVGIVAMCWMASVRVSRLDAFFVLSAVMLLGPDIATAVRRIARNSTAASPTQRAGVGGIAVAVLVIGLAGASASRGNFTCIAMDEQWAPEPEAVVAAKARQLSGRMLTFFDWGEYAIWHLGPDIKVSMDGRRETVYSEDLIAGHFAFYRDEPDALRFVDEVRPDYVWLPARLSVLKTLELAGWVPIFTGSKSAILARSETGAADQLATVSDGRRCFPGP